MNRLSPSRRSPSTRGCLALLGCLVTFHPLAADEGALNLFAACDAISVSSTYTGEAFTNARGGRSTQDATQYLGLLDVELSLDLTRAGAPIPGAFNLLAQNTHGRGITDDFVGDTQVISNIDSSRNILQVSEYWWEFDLLSEDIMIRVGKRDINTEFLFIDTATHFVHSTFGLSPSTAFPTYPDPSMGAVAIMQLTESWQLKAGVWDAFAAGSSWGFSGNDSLLLITELERTYTLPGGLPGVFAVGAAYESDGEIDGEPVSAVHEYIVQLEQRVFQESPHGDQGLAVFAGYYPRFPGQQIVDTSIGDSFVAGLTYTGLLPGRNEDSLGIGVAWSELFQGGTNHETITEAYYRIEFEHDVSLQPDIQYIASPSGVFSDALAIGLRFQLRH